MLGVIILVQNPKGGGLSQSLGGVSTQVFGAKNSTNLVEKLTWYLAVAILVLSLASSMFISKGTAAVEEEGSFAGETIDEQAIPTPDILQPGVEPLPGTQPEGTEPN